MQTYEGMENYIFVSYAHKDSDRVLPIIQALNDAGYRVWYDAGIEAGTEWPEYVAEHLYNSAVVLVFLSKNALNSQNCTREINFAVSERKEMLVVYMEELQLSLGMRMQLGTLQAIFYDRYASLREFMQALSAAKILNGCQSKNAAPMYANTKQTAPRPVKATSAENYVFSQKETYLSPYTGEVYPCCAVAPQKDFKDKHIFIPESSDRGVPVGRIQREAFMMSRIESVHIPHSVRVIDESAFNACDRLKTLSIENGVELIEPSAFRNCDALQRIILPQSLKKIGHHAFDFCEALELVELPDGLEYIGQSAFAGCKFHSIFIPKSVKTIDFCAFDPDSLATIYCEAEHRPMGWNDVFCGFLDEVQIVWGVSREQAKKMENN